MTIKEMPAYGDAWMRRGQSRAAMGNDEDALQDFEQCLALTSEPARKVFPCTISSEDLQPGLASIPTSCSSSECFW